MTIEVLQIATDSIKFFVQRSRNPTVYARLKESIREIGLKVPIGVRDMSDRPKKERRRQGAGGYYRYELVYGQGRLQAFRQLGFEKIPAMLVDVSEEEIVGRFLAENVMRRNFSWREKAKLIEYDVEENELTVEDVAQRYYITVSHAKKYLRIIRGASDKTLSRADDGEIDMNLAEKLTTLSKEDQDSVIEVLDERQLDKSAIVHLVDQAAKIRSNGARRVTKSELAQSIDDLNSQHRKCRERFKLKRFEFGLGPQHLFQMAEDELFVSRARDAGIDLSYFIRK